MASGVVCGLLLVSAPVGALAEPVRAPDLGVLVERIQAEIDFRREMALPHAPAYVASLHFEPVPLSKVDWNGMLFTAAEAAELRARDLAAAEINAVTRRYMGNQRTDTFAGLYLDHAAGGVMTVLVTKDVAKHRSALSRLVSDPARLSVRKVSYSERNLVRMQDRVAEAQDALRKRGITIGFTSIDVPGNRVVVGVPEATVEVRAALATIVPAGALRFDQGTQLSLAVCDTGLDCSTESPPFDGGTDIESYDAWLGGISFCTLGFVGRSTSNGTAFVLTAGHCGPTLSTWVQQATPIGYVGKNSFRGITTADALSISVRPELARGQVKGYRGVYRKITSHERVTDDYIGKPTCAYGIRTNYRCGKIVSRSFRASFDDVILKGQRVASRPCGPGDSGGPNYYYSRAQGITSFSARTSTGKTYCGYSHIASVLSKMGLNSVASR